jgi:hypothetical protein
MSLLAASLALGILAAPPQRLATYDDLMSAALQGRQIRAVIDYSKTVMVIDGKEEKAPAAIGGMTFMNWEQFAPGVVRNKLAYLVSSETHLISHPRHGHVFNYVRLRIYSDGKVEITAQYLKNGALEIVMDETFKGSLSSGKDSHGVSLFAAP